jgi:hypothetical protein
MKELFTDDFQQEEARFAAAIPTTDRNTGGAAGPSGTREFGARDT